MNILMMTNTYKPILGGLEKSVEIFCNEFRRRKHNVLIVTPRMKDASLDEDGVVRVPAIQNFNNTDFSVELPISHVLAARLKEFRPDIVHSHHPFLIGDTALRVSAEYKVPIAFTHHTMYEDHTHYLPVHARRLRPFVIELSTGYANLCDVIFAPSKCVRDLLCHRGVRRPITVNPTGVYSEDFNSGDADAFRRDFGIPSHAYCIGYTGRFAQEKNIIFLCSAVAEYLDRDPGAVFVMIGGGPLLDEAGSYFEKRSLSSRVFFTGPMQGQALINGYCAMDVFVFASKTETQGITVLEAMASGVPIIALDTPVLREVVIDGGNGFIAKEDPHDFSGALARNRERDASLKSVMRKSAIDTARRFDVNISAERALHAYRVAVEKGCCPRDAQDSPWRSAARQLKAELDLIENVMRAAGSAIMEEGETKSDRG